MKKFLLSALFALGLLVPGAAVAQSGCSTIVYGAVLTAAQWNACFAAKQNTLGYTPVNKAGDTMLGKLVTITATTATAGLNLPQGAAPTIPVNGDLWTTLSGVYARINGATVGPFVDTTSGAVASFSAGSTGFTPSSATTGAVTLAGTLIGANGGTGVANTGKTITISASLVTTGAGAPTLAFGGSTATYTYPTTTATLARTDAGQTFTGTQAFGAITYSTLNGNTWGTGTGTLSIAAGKTLTASNTLTFTGTDASSVAFGTGGTVLYSGGAYVSSLAGTANEITASASTGAVTLSLPAALTFTGKTVTGGTFAGPTVTGSFTATGLVTLADHSTQATNTVIGNATSGTASPTALAVGSCSSASSALIWTTNTGFGCNTSITAAAVPVGGITGLGTGVATWLATPSSANLATAVTDETGSGALVFGTAPSVSSLTVTSAFTATGLVTNADLVNSTVSVNGTTCTLGSSCTPPSNGYTATFLAVGGGGAGGYQRGGGGGGGDVSSGSTTITVGRVYTITVGAGSVAQTSTARVPGVGGTSYFDTIATAIGGGNGGNGITSATGNPDIFGFGANGGSGGGGGGDTNYGKPGGFPTGHGFAGGIGVLNGTNTSCPPGGGGGAGAVGSAGSSTAGGAGGAGVASSITGSSLTYGGGGGGGGISPDNTAGAGGAGGGGAGSVTTTGTAGTANLGGGGGGGANGFGGGAGGTGVVIVSVPTASYTGTTTGSPTVTTSGGNTIMKFTASGTYTGNMLFFALVMPAGRRRRKAANDNAEQKVA